MRQMSFYLTRPQIRDRSKTVTRRTGWTFLKPGDLLQAVEKGHGIPKGQSVVRMGVLRVVGVTVERLRRIVDDPVYGREELVREGFPDMTPEDFVAMLIGANPRATVDDLITRIEFEYVDRPAFTGPLIDGNDAAAFAAEFPDLWACMLDELGIDDETALPWPSVAAWALDAIRRASGSPARKAGH